MCTKMVHLELIPDLSVQALQAALKRFIAHRGVPSDIYSDNAKNFSGLANQLKRLFQYLKESEVQYLLSCQKINWHFIPPHAPHILKRLCRIVYEAQWV